MKKTTMAYLVASALALPMGAYAQAGDDGAGSNDGKMNTTNPNIGGTPSTKPDQPANRPAAGSTVNRSTGANTEAASPNRSGSTTGDANRSASTTASDAALTAKVKTQLIKDRDVSAMNVNVDTANGVVTLKGNAKNRAEADKAASLARSVEGVKSVNNQLVVGTASTSNPSRGSSTGAAAGSSTSRGSDNARSSLENKPTPPKEGQERPNAERTN